ncbi:MAG TPA: hypothetical protein VLC53_04330 [Myxococcota bacterium]|nr:hypothetical protein [Myxococcota bacterium]
MTIPSRPLRAAWLAAAVLWAAPAQAAFHLWHVKEVYSNADGSIQYVELFTGASTEGFVSGQVLEADSDGVVRSFTVSADLAGSTANRHLLFATPGFAALPGAPTPDFVLDCGPFFDPGADSITIDWANGFDTLVFSGAVLPTDGATSLTDTTPTAAPTLVSGPNSPTNFAGTVGQLALTACLADGSCDACDDGLFCNGAETCIANQCESTGNPCDPETQTCVEEPPMCVPEPGAAASAISAWLALAGGAAAGRHASSARPG